MVGSGRMVTSSRRAGRVTNKTKLLIYRGSDKVDLAHAEVILWTDGEEGNAPKNQHVGAKGVESGEMLEHHLQAALSSHSLLHSQTATKPSSPTPASSSRLNKTDTSATASSSTASAPAALNYHIPTPDATGLTVGEEYVRLYQSPKSRYNEPSGFIRFSDTVEEASGGWGGLGYCMDDEDEKWLADFNGKQQGGSGSSGSTSAAAAADSPVREGKENVPVSAGRERRGKGKDKEKEKESVSAPPPPLVISDDAFEFVMGMLEKYADDITPAIHTNLSLLPTYAMVETLFSSPISPSFLPSNEVPRTLPEAALLTRMSRSIYTHWKSRRERRKGRPIMPQLNYDETNDGDPYVCFRRRDIRATRKTRRTDNFSVEQMQKLQYELRTAHEIAKLVVAREHNKRDLYASEKDVWEAKWKLYETKKRWPALGLTPDEEMIIVGRIGHGSTGNNMVPGQGGYGSNNVHMSNINGQALLGVPRVSKKMAEREKEIEREKRERMAEANNRGGGDRTGGVAARWFAPDELKARMQALRSKLEEEMTRRKETDMDWDDATDSSFQPLPNAQGEHAYRTVVSLDPQWAREQDEKDYTASRLPTFRLRRGRNGIDHLDRRYPSPLSHRGSPPSTVTAFSKWLFPDTCSTRLPSRRPRSIDDVDDTLSSPDDSCPLKRRRLNETWHYNSDNGGAVGVGMGLDEDTDHIIIDDMDSKYIRHRVTLLRDDDMTKLQPDISVIRQAMSSVDEPQELPPMPIFIRPPPPQNQFVSAQLQQQAVLQQQQQQAQMEQFQRFQLQAQLQAQMQVQVAQQAAQQQAAQAVVAAQQQQLANGNGGQQLTPEQVAAQLQLQQQQHLRLASNGSNGSNGTPVIQNAQMMPPSVGQTQNGRPPVKRTASAMSGATANGTNNPMPPPSQTPLRPPSASPVNAIQHLPLANGNTNPPQMMNGTLLGPNGTPKVQGQAMDPAFQQRLIAQARATQHAQHQLQQQQQLQQQNMQVGGGDINDNNIAALNALIANTANVQQQQQASQAQMQLLAQQGVGANGANGVNGTNPDLYQQAQAAGFNNIQAYLDARNKARILKMASVQQQQQQAAVNGGGGVPMSSSTSNSSVQASPSSQKTATANGTSNGGSGGGGQGSANGSPALPTGHLQLKLPPHAKARLAGQQQVIVQRAQ